MFFDLYYMHVHVYTCTCTCMYTFCMYSLLQWWPHFMILLWRTLLFCQDPLPSTRYNVHVVHHHVHCTYMYMYCTSIRTCMYIRMCVCVCIVALVKLKHIHVHVHVYKCTCIYQNNFLYMYHHLHSTHTHTHTMHVLYIVTHTHTAGAQQWWVTCCGCSGWSSSLSRPSTPPERGCHLLVWVCDGNEGLCRHWSYTCVRVWACANTCNCVFFVRFVYCVCVCVCVCV